MPPDLCPVADGGEGTLDALLPGLGGEIVAAGFEEEADPLLYYGSRYRRLAAQEPPAEPEQK